MYLAAADDRTDDRMKGLFDAMEGGSSDVMKSDERMSRLDGKINHGDHQSVLYIMAHAMKGVTDLCF